MLPEDKCPLVIVFATGETLLLWASEFELPEWVSRLQEFGQIRTEGNNDAILIRSEQNYFSATIYMHLEKEVKKGEDDEPVLDIP